jgi:hypothetical protein
MAKKQIKKYIFTPGAAGVGKLVIEGKWDLNSLLLITNVTRGVILYNFADTINTGASVSFKPGGIPSTPGDTSVITYGKDLFGATGTAQIQNAISGVGETTITFTTVSTVGYSANDEISVFVEEKFQYVRPWSDFGTDAIERTRTAHPQSMIDADFEYGLQATKWQSVELVNQYPSIYEQAGLDLTVFSITSSAADPSLITCNTFPQVHGLSVNSPITVQQLDVGIDGFSRAQGSSLTYSVGTYDFAYYAKGQVGTTPGTSISSPRTQIRTGGFYSGSVLPVTSVVSDGATPSLISITLGSPHGFTPGMPLLVGADTTVGSGLFANMPGSYYANAITSSTTANFYARGFVASGTYTPDDSNKIKMYIRPDGFFIHRPGDGGILLGTGSATHGAAAQRQSKKYFRYQSGKGFLYTTGVLFAPNYDIVSMAAINPSVLGAGIAKIRIETSIPHGLQPGSVVRVTGISTEGYNGQYTVESIDDDVTIMVTAIDDLSSANGDVSAVPKLYIYQWHGSCIRTGPHDDSNGMFFEYDGKYFNVVKRTSTLQLAGTATFTPDSNLIAGVGTKWSAQLKIGDRIVIKGMVHKVNFVNSDTSISVSPFFRGVATTSGNYIWKVEETRVDQPNFNADRADGTGPSGYRMDPNHMQMVGIQFSWYGAGFMDFMVRGHDANFIILHRLKQNNINTTASMRSANLPVRYEVNNEASNGVVSLKTAGTVSAVTTDNIAISDATFFPPSGLVYIDYELIRYDAINTASPPWPLLTGLTRAASANVYIGGSYRQFYGAAATTHSFGAGVELVSLTATPNMSHWGSSYIIDGGFDLDRGYAFSYTASSVTIGSNVTSVFGLRLAPSASNGSIGDLGSKELLNRAQLLLDSIDVVAPDVAGSDVANASIVVSGVLNPSNYYDGSNWTPLNSQSLGNQPSFTQIATTPTFTGGFYANGTQIGVQGWGQEALPGEKIFEFVTSPGERSSQDLSMIKELTQSAVGGRGTFPNGSDTLYINIGLLPGTMANTNVLGNVSVTLRWGEAQA